VSISCIIHYALVAYWVILFVRILGSWFPIPPSGPIRKVMDVVYDLTEPVMRPLRNMLPPIRMGMMALDLSPIIVFIVIGILSSYIQC
jgi:YggT family protein